MNENKFRVLELFAGIGACSKALKRMGIDVEIVDAVEIDKFAIASFNAIHGTDFKVQDIKEWDKDIKDIDLITHGSPCQDFSIAGKQAGNSICVPVLEKIFKKLILFYKNDLTKMKKYDII